MTNPQTRLLELEAETKGVPKHWTGHNLVAKLEGYRMALSDLNARYGDVVRAAEAARDHLEELVEAWRRGALSEHDTTGMNGTRSNRNFAVTKALVYTLKALKETP